MPHLIKFSVEEIRKLVDYNPETGAFTWLPRENKSWNSRYAGKRAAAYTSSDTGYSLVVIARKQYYAHQMAWIHFYGEPPQKGMHIDHINGDKTDNRIANLRIATVAQNVQNQKLHIDNTSGYKGVCFHKPTKKWMARIRSNNRYHYLGLFDAAEEAYAAYMEASKQLHGEFSHPG